MTTLVTDNVIGAREDLGDVITVLDTGDTPIWSNAAKAEGSGVIHEWLFQSLAAATDSKAAEGADFSAAASAQPTRIQNVMQINTKVRKVSDTSEAVSLAGRASELARQRLLVAKELRRDVELALVTDNAYVSSGTREAASITSYLSNVSFSTAGSTSALAANNQNGSAAITTTGTDRSLTIAMIDTVMQAIFEDGGEADMMVLSPQLKNAFSGISNAFAPGTANQVTTAAGQAITITGAVDVYSSDFSTLQITPSRVMAANHNDRVFLLDSDYYTIVNLPGRNFVEVDLAKTSDAQTSAIVYEWTLRLDNPLAHGAVIDIDGTVT